MGGMLPDKTRTIPYAKITLGAFLINQFIGN